MNTCAILFYFALLLFLYVFYLRYAKGDSGKSLERAGSVTEEIVLCSGLLVAGGSSQD